MNKLAIYATLLISGMIMPHLKAEQCSNSDLQGAYSFVLSGTFNGLPFAAAGQTLYSGDGTAVGVIQASSGGSIFPPATWTAKYSLSAMETNGQTACVLTKTLVIPAYGNLTVSFFGTAGNGFKELRFIAITPTSTLSGSATRQ